MLKNKKVLIITIIVLVVLIAAFVYFFFFYKTGSDFGIGEKRRAEIITELSADYVAPITDQERIEIIQDLTSETTSNSNSNSNSISDQSITEAERASIINDLSGN